MIILLHLFFIVCSICSSLFAPIFKIYFCCNIGVKVFENGPSKIWGRQPLKHLKWYGLPKADHTRSNFLKAVFHKFYLVHSWTLCSIRKYEKAFSRLRAPLSKYHWLNPFLPIVLFWSLWKHQKTKGFLMFSGGSKGSIGKRRANTSQEFGLFE